ncbi:type III pantothenate kinase [Denitratisoma oestradiolicum]|uniref:Type III pantothenate kinase n=1 Tax=Denitratisoma oestradiolicum TaxID=311182 RepID=A0A6S6Y6B8_9PROT|nr:type III pantothenate kinase [Denitratisoma oestradiolicum]TWO80658.1 type III pantothenate kinase [Denitratisoma oestradiolicum]CAB1371062.1 Type III pantothenate kinase [Denitratisoma oestradiolicum]
MILCLDCGNTRIKWGLREGDTWKARGAFATTATTEAEGLARVLPRTPLIRILGCNVAGAEVAQALANVLPLPIEWNLPRTEQCGVSNAYEQPGQLGADRWAALIGAWHLQGAACLVVSAGTATTIDVLDSSGIFQGGLILPGLDLMRQALARNTAQLPSQSGQYRETPRNTLDAISSGAIHATLGAISRMYAQVADRPGAACLLTGGAAEALAPHLTLPLRRVEDLVLEGLARITAPS